VSDEDLNEDGLNKKLDALRQDVFTATVNRGLVYKAILEEMRKELGEAKASQIFKRAIRDHGEKMAGLLNPPATMAEFEQWLLAMLPDDGAMHEPEVLRCDEEGLDIKFHRCPLKEGWRMLNMTREQVEDMCRHADSFDHGLFGSVFDYSMEPWSQQPDDSCVLRFRPKRG
jgi:predicted ArsR family transcriptional regulator